MRQNLLWIDVETTGLYPDQGLILEIAAAITDKRLEKIQEIRFVTAYCPEVIDEHLTDYTREIHTKNGLLAEIPKFGVRLDRIEKELVWFCQAYRGAGLWLAGSKPDFDRAWIDVHMPVLARQPHYRNFDMNALYAWYNWPKCEKDRPHRAMADINEDIEVLRTIAKTYLTDEGNSIMVLRDPDGKEINQSNLS